MRNLLPIVEGDGDLKAVPVLIRRILDLHEIYDVKLLPPQKRGELPKVRGDFENYFHAASKWSSAILWVMDFDCSDCDCVKNASEALYEKAKILNPEVHLRIAFIRKEFETYFLIEQSSAREVLKIPETFEFPDSPETIRGAKGVLNRALPKGVSYKEMVHQDKISARLNLDYLREKSSDFRHLEKSILHLVNLQNT